MNSDYLLGDEPLPVGTVVRYLCGLGFVPYRIVLREEPPEGAFPEDYPDGVAYGIWPVGRAQKRGHRDQSIRGIKRTVLRVESLLHTDQKGAC